MTQYSKALARVNILKGHLRPSKEAKEERKNPSFSVEAAREAFWETYPKGYFEGYEALSELRGMTHRSFYFEDRKEVVREDTNKFFVSYVNKIFEKGFTNPEKIAENIDYFLACFDSINSLDYNTLTKLMVQYGLYCKTIKNLGTEKHKEILLEGTSLRTMGCFGLTEIGHGSNVRGIETTAEYDPETEEFIINSPTDTSAKFWIGNLAKTAHNAVIFAQLVTHGENKGVHAFVFEVRDRSNHLPHPRIEIGDCGDKKGAHGIDNGWIKFKYYRVPRDSLLDKFGSVDKEGNYHSSIEKAGKRFANSIASLSGGRVLISRLSCEAGLIASATALRYGCARKQFGTGDGEEVALINYPSYQYKTITRFVDHFIDVIACNRMVDLWISNLPNLLKEKNRVTNLCHGLCSNTKAFVAWGVHDSLFDLRRACGGFGYAKYSLFDELIDINDLNQTWEGDNHVLIMQTQQFLFKCLRWLSKEEELPETVEFLTLSPPEIEITKVCIFDLNSLIKIFADRANHLVHRASHVLMIDATKIAQHFEDSQAFEMLEMCRSYHDYYLITSFKNWFEKIKCDKTRKMFEKFLLLSIHKKILGDSKYFSQIFETGIIDKIQAQVVKTLKELRKDIIPLTDVIPYPGIMMGALGHEDLQVYDRILQHVKATDKVTEKASWWKLTYANSEQR